MIKMKLMMMMQKTMIVMIMHSQLFTEAKFEDVDSVKYQTWQRFTSSSYINNEMKLLPKHPTVDIKVI